MMKKNGKKFVAMLMGLTFAATGFAGCGGGGGLIQPPDDSSVVVDTTKSQLYVGCWDGGFRDQWLRDIAKRFEEFYADYEFETGKKGVQVHVSSSKFMVYESFAKDIVNQPEEICFSEQCNNYGFVEYGTAIDITDAVTTPLTEYGESVSIADKLSVDDREFYSVEQNGESKYYGIPWYESTFGFQYDVDLFEEYNLFFAADGAGDSQGFVKNANTKRSKGPDGKEGTDDDGLPATYDDFFKMCDKMYTLEITPVLWAGNVQAYVNNFAMALAIDGMGYEQGKAIYELDGTVADKLIESINGDKITYMDPVELTNENGYLRYRQEGYYNAIKFLEKLINTKENGEYKYYEYDHCFSPTASHTATQAKFLQNKYLTNAKPVAMIMDGSWWYSEAESVFTAMSSIPGAGKLERRIGFMPYPKATAADVGETTYLNSWMTSVNIRSNIDASKIPMAKAFIRFAHTNESLSSFTRITSGVRPYSYTLTETDAANTSYYGSTLLDIHNNQKVLNPWSENKLIINNLSQFMINTNTFNATVAGKSQSFVSSGLEEGISAKDYFFGLSNYFNQSAWNMQFSKYFD